VRHIKIAVSLHRHVQALKQAHVLSVATHVMITICRVTILQSVTYSMSQRNDVKGC
jgi:hypothetical protein